jgi:hypothetical protein
MKEIAMKATQEDWDSVKYLVKKYKKIAGFINFPYLVTNYRGNLGIVSNNDINHKNIYHMQIYETFDRAIFLEALDIVDEKVWKGNGMQWKCKDGTWKDMVYGEIEYRLKPINPEVKQLKELAEKLGYKIEKL